MYVYMGLRFGDQILTTHWQLLNSNDEKQMRYYIWKSDLIGSELQLIQCLSLINSSNSLNKSHRIRLR